MTGGNQLKLSAIVCGTPVGDADRARPPARRGGRRHLRRRQHPVVAHGGVRRGGATPKHRMAQVPPGSGLLARRRRSTSTSTSATATAGCSMIVAQTPSCSASASTRTPRRGDLEDGHEVLRVRARRGHDHRRPAHWSPTPTRPSASLAAAVPRRASSTCCPPGAAFDLTERTPGRRTRPPVTRPRTPPSSREAQADLRRMARDIAAGRRRADPLCADAWPASARPARLATRRRRPTPTDDRTETPGDRTPDPDLDDHRDPRLPRAQLLVLRPAIHLVVDIGALEELPTDMLPGFTEQLLRALPGLRGPPVLARPRGGFVERLHEGTWLGHVTEHVALELQQAAGHDIRRGKTRGVTGERGLYNVIYGYLDETVGARGRPAGRRGWSTTCVAGRPRSSTSTAELRARSSCAPSARRSARRRRPSWTRPSAATSRGSG